MTTQQLCATGKIIYYSHNAAHRAMTAVAKKEAKRCTVYRCVECNRWHWGHQIMRKPKYRRGRR